MLSSCILQEDEGRCLGFVDEKMKRWEGDRVDDQRGYLRMRRRVEMPLIRSSVVCEEEENWGFLCPH